VTARYTGSVSQPHRVPESSPPPLGAPKAWHIALSPKMLTASRRLSASWKPSKA
jgi:hypothetical protein